MNSLQKIFWISLLVKMVLAALLPMTSDETYYWVWSYHPQLNYYDHPAMVAWLFYLGQPLEAFGSMVRWPGVLLSQATLYLWLKLSKEHLKFDDKQAQDWLWLALLNPLFGAGALIITPDIPLLFFSALSLFCFLNILKRPTSLKGFIFGVALGLGLISKYMIVLIPLALVCASLFHLDWWKKLAPKLPVILLGFVLGALPFFLWNIQNDWVSVRFQMDHGLGSKTWKLSWTYEYLALQLLAIFPTMVFLIFRGYWRSPYWLKAMAVVPLFFFLITSFRGYVEANWPIMAYPALLVMAVQGGFPKVQKVTCWIWGVVIAGVVLLVISQYSPLEKPIKTKEFYEFEDLYDVARNYDPLFARSYQMASRLTYEVKRPIYKLRGYNRRDAYDFWSGSLPPEHFYMIVHADENLSNTSTDFQFEVLGERVINERFKLIEVRRK